MSDIGPATPAMLPDVLDLLKDAGLPTAGVEEHFGTFWVSRIDGRLVGCIGLERHGEVGLLRSLAVRSSEQARGVGRRLVEHLLSEAREQKLRTLYLLTTTADAYFPRFGFERIERGEIDPALQGSEELRGACPDTAVCMRLRF
jgi:amino-acid N-acetyltransferase